MIDKQALRLKMEKQREQLNAGQKAQIDALICQELLQLVVEKNARKVHTFLPMGTEVNIYPFITTLLANGIEVYCPKTMPERQLQHLRLSALEELEEGVFGTRHPKGAIEAKGTFDLIVVPGLAFDRNNNRLGYGGGYYDIFLRDHPDAFKVGIGYGFQLIESLPLEAHDVPLDKIIC